MEIERQLKQKQHLIVAVFIAIGVVIVAAVAWAIFINIATRHIITFQGERIPTDELRLFASLVEPGEGANELALNELVTTLVILDRAENAGFYMTEEEMDESLINATMFFGDSGTRVDMERIAELMGSWSFLVPHLVDYYVPTYELNPEEFAEGLAEYIEINSSLYSEFYVRYIVSQNFDDMILAEDRLAAGEDFENLIHELSIIDTEEAETLVHSAFELMQFLEDWADWEAITELQEGEVSRIIMGNGLFFLVEMYERIDATHEEMEESFREQFTRSRREAAFVDMLTNWVDNADYTVNERALRRIG